MSNKYDTERYIEPKKALPEFIVDKLPPDITGETERLEFFMGEAVKMAKVAALHGDVPVGCVIVRHNEIIAAAENRREMAKDATAHAEILAIKDACRALGGWRLVASEIFVTLEPCPMCAGAIVNARIPKVTVGAREPKSGAFGGMFDICSLPLNHRPEYRFGILEDECTELTRGFFKSKR